MEELILSIKLKQLFNILKKKKSDSFDQMFDLILMHKFHEKIDFCKILLPNIFSKIASNHKQLFILILVSVSLFLNAQESDFQTWGDISARYKINKKWRLNSELGLRTRENSQYLKQYYLEIGGSYKINKRFDLTTKYRFTNYFKTGKTSIHRWATDVSYDNKWKRFTWQVRGRYQHEWFVSNYSQKFDEQSWRTKFEVSYNIRKTKLDPYLAFEHFMGLNGKYKLLTTDIRFTIGAEYPINKWSDIDVNYKIESEFYIKNPLTAYILSITYKIDLN